MQNIVNITLENFQDIILEQSKHKHVLLDFWAPNLEQCEQLQPVIAGLAAKFADDMLYGRVNCQEQQQIAQQFGIQSLPTVLLVKDGQPIDGFAGLQLEDQILEMLEKHLPKASDGLYAKAVEFVNQSDYQQAYTSAKQAYDFDNTRADFAMVLADCNVELGNIKQAKVLLESIGLVDQNGYYHSIQGKIELAEQAAQSPEIKQLRSDLKKDPTNLQIKVDLAIQLHQANQPQEALELLFSVLKKDLNFADAKKYTMDMINAMPDGEPLKSEYRRKIYSLLY